MFGWLFGSKKQEPVADITNAPGTYDIRVAGTGYRQKALRTVAGGKTEDGHEIDCQADLVFEDDNPKDPKAVAVYIDGEHVGYLDRANARAFRNAMGDAAGDGVSRARCPALIVGGWDRGDDDTGHYGVKLDLPTAMGTEMGNG